MKNIVGILLWMLFKLLQHLWPCTLHNIPLTTFFQILSWHTFASIIIFFFLSRDLPSACLEYIPRYSPPRFNLRARKQLTILHECEEELKLLEEDFTRKKLILSKRLSSIQMSQFPNSENLPETTEGKKNPIEVHIKNSQKRPPN